MANVNSTLYTKQVGSAGASPAVTYPLAKVAGGKLRYYEVEGTVADLGATNDTFTLCRLKVGARVLPGLSKIICESPGTTVTGKIGDASDDDRYLAAKALGGSAQDIFWTNSPGVAGYVGYEIVAGNEVIVWTSTNIGTPTAAAKIKFLIAVLDE